MKETNKSGPSLYQKSIQGGLWIILGHHFNKLLNLVRAVVLARFLLPRDFGQMAIAILSVSIIDTFTQVGVRQALIQKHHPVADDLDTGWTLGIIRGLIICVSLFILAPWIAFFFDGSAQLSQEDILRPKEAAIRIFQEDNASMSYLRNQFPEEIRLEFIQHDANLPLPAHLKTQLQKSLNEIIFSEPLWSQEAFSAFPLSNTTRNILNQKIQNGDTPRSNRVLIEELFSEGKCIRPAILDIRTVTGIIQSMGFLFLLSSFINIGVLYFSRDLNFGRQFIFQSAGSIAGTVAAISIAVIYQSVWALILGRLVGTFVQCVLSYLVHPYRPRLRIKWQHARAMWKFGRHVMWTAILRFFVIQGDDLFVGKILGLGTLGLYRYAYHFSSLIASEAGDIINKVAFPAFSRIQNNLPKIRGGYEKSIRYIVLAAYPFSGGLMVLAHELVSVILGPEWLDMVPTLQILCILGFCKGMQGGNVFMALGRPGLITRLYGIRLFLMAISIYPLTKYFGMPGTAISVVVPSLIIMPIHLLFVQQCIGHTLYDFLKTIFAPLVSTLIMAFSLILLKLHISLTGILGVLVLVVLGIVIYGFSMYLLSRFFREYDPVVLYKNIRKGWN